MLVVEKLSNLNYKEFDDVPFSRVVSMTYCYVMSPCGWLQWLTSQLSPAAPPTGYLYWTFTINRKAHNIARKHLSKASDRQKDHYKPQNKE